MQPNERLLLFAAAPAKWFALAVAAFSWPILLGVAIGVVPSINPLFRGDRSRWFHFWLVTVVILWAVAIVVTVLMARAGVSTAAVGLVPPTTAATAFAAFVVVGFAIGARLIGQRAAALPGPTSHGLVLLPHTPSERLFMVLVIAPSAAVCEELVYRGFLLLSLAAAMGAWPANIAQALLFAFHHGGTHQGVPAFLGRAGIGILFGVVALHTGTLVGVIAVHYLVDAALALRPSRAAIVAPKRPNER